MKRSGSVPSGARFQPTRAQLKLKRGKISEDGSFRTFDGRVFDPDTGKLRLPPLQVNRGRPYV